MKHKHTILAILVGWLIGSILPTPQQILGKLRGKGGS